MTLTDEWQEYKATFKMPSDYTTFNYLVFGHPAMEEAKAGQAFVIDDLYVAEEKEYSINITTNSDIITPQASIKASAEVLNQVGTKGNLNQNIRWFFVSEDRKSIIEGANIQETENGIEISIDETVPSGMYAIVAVSDELIKGKAIKVISSFADTESPELNQNLIVDSGCVGSGWGNNASWGYANFKDGGRTGDAVKLSSKGNIALDEYNTYWPTYGAQPSQYINEDKNSVFEAGENYVLSIWAKDVKEDESLPYSKITTAFMCNTGKVYLNEYPQGTSMQLTDDWQEFKGSFTVPAGYTKYSGFPIGYPVTEVTTAGMAMAIDDAYLAKEQAYSVEITGTEEIGVGETATFTASLLNQAGTKGKLPQEFRWFILNADRTAYADGVIIVENENGTVSVTGIEEGTYTIIAMSEANDFIKGYTVTVAEVAETPVEKIATAVFEKTGSDVNFKASVENAAAENVFFVIGEFSGNDLVKTAKSDLKPASDANCDLTLENVIVGNTIRAFIWNMGTLFPIDNVDNLALDYTVTE